MRLFQTGGFYLHDSPRLSAEWLNDKDTVSYVRNTGVLLSSVLQLHCLERDEKLYPPDYTVLESCSDVCEWAMASIHSIAWLIDYYECLASKAERVFKHSPLTWEFRRTLKDYLYRGCFDEDDVNPRDWLPMSPSEARYAYKAEIKLYTFRKVPLPYWLGSNGQKAAAPVYTPPAIPDYDLTPLDEI